MSKRDIPGNDNSDKASEENAMEDNTKENDADSDDHQGDTTVMNEVQEIEGISEEAPDTSLSPETSVRREDDGRTGAIVLVALVVILLFALIGVAGVGYMGWQQLQHADHQLDNKMQLASQQGIATEKQLQQLENEFQPLQRQSQQWQKKFSAAETKIEQTQETVAQVKQRLDALAGRDYQDWLVAEAEYLVRVGVQKANLEKDVTASIMLLSAADARLKQFNEPKLHAVRQQLAQDIAQLKAVQGVDVEGIVLAIDALLPIIETLPLASIKIPEGSAAFEIADGDEWKQRLQKTWENIKKQLVTIRRQDKPIEPLLPPDQHRHLYLNITQTLQQAQLAAFRRQHTLYARSLERAIEWIEQFYDKDAGKTQRVVQQLKTLASNDVKQEMPNIDGGLHLLGRYLDSRMSTALNHFYPTGNRHEL